MSVRPGISATLSKNMLEGSAHPKSMWLGFLVALGYGTVSITITLFNKAVFSWYHFNYPNTLTAAQMIFALLFLAALKAAGAISYPDFDRNTARKVFPLTFFFIAMVVTGLAALRYVNVPMYGALRRGTTWIVMLGEQMILHKTYPSDEAWSVHIMIFGAMIAGVGDLTFHFLGYFLTGLNCLVTALYLVYIPKKREETSLNGFGLMYYNNLLSLPTVIVIMLVLEWQDLSQYALWLDPGFQMVFVASAIQAFLLNYLIFLCSTVNSPLTTSITGQLKNILQTLVGLFLFGDVIPTMALAAGLFISTVASVWYGHIKYQQELQRAKATSG